MPMHSDLYNVILSRIERGETVIIYAAERPKVDQEFEDSLREIAVAYGYEILVNHQYDLVVQQAPEVV